MKRFVFLFFILIFAGTCNPLPAQPPASRPEWRKISSGVLEAHFGSIITSSVTPQIIFLDSRHCLWRSLDEGSGWTRVFDLPGGTDAAIHRIYISPHKSSSIYAATTEGLFASDDFGNHFDLLFSSAGKKERNCVSLAFHPMDPDILFLGTGNGLFWSLDGGEKWTREILSFDNEEILKILPPEQPESHYLILTSSSLFSLSRDGKDLTLLYKIPFSKEENNPEESIRPSNRLLDVARRNQSVLLASENNLLESGDQGRSWQLFPMHGFQSGQIRKLLTAENGRLFAAASSGVYEFEINKKRWKAIIDGLENTDIHDINFNSSGGGKLFAVNTIGAFRLILPAGVEIEAAELSASADIPAESLNELEEHLSSEPTVRDVQQAAVRYGDLNPEKIRNWHRQSRIRNFLPRLSGGLTRSHDQNIDIDRGSTNTSDVFIIGPEETSWDEDISVSWNLADLVWSTDQTSIDTRSKLMAELRNELLANVTRIYFERQRKITEFFLELPADPLLRIDLMQRIEELTAHLDALTGSYLTRELEYRNVEQPWKDYKTVGSGDFSR